MEQKDWAGIFPAITTPFAGGSVNRLPGVCSPGAMDGEERLPGHCRTRVTGRIAHPDRWEEKVDIVKNLRRSLDAKAPVIAGIAALWHGGSNLAGEGGNRAPVRMG